MVQQLAEADAVSRQTGKCAEWFEGSDPETLQIAGEANGFLFAALLGASGYKDCACADLLRKGGAFVGELERSGIGTPIDAVQGSTDKLCQGVRERNAKLLESLVEDPNSHELLRIARADAGLGRMSIPEKLCGSVPDNVLLHPRFGVCQEKSDGTRKCRAVDNFSWSPGDPKCWKSNSKKRQKVDSVSRMVIVCFVSAFAGVLAGQWGNLHIGENAP